MSAINKISKKMGFIYTETNGLHELNEDVSKKTLYGFCRLVVLNYEIGYLENNIFISTIKNRIIIKPRCMNITEETSKIHGITNEIANDQGADIEETLITFLQNLKDVSIIISHNILFHLRTIQAECIRYNIQHNFKKNIIIDTSNFYHNIQYPKLKDLYETIYNKKPKKKLNLELIKLCFLKLYNDYEVSIISKN